MTKLAIMLRVATAALIGGALAFSALPASAAGKKEHAPEQDWSFEGPIGHYDLPSLQRGLQVYLEVCAGCHSLKYVAYRDLAAIGYGEDEIKAIAARYEVADGPDDAGDMFQRPARPSDRFVSPFANEQQARASNGGALPPDLSLQAKAHLQGPDYIYALLTGYKEAPADVKMNEGMQYNPYFAGGQIAMPAPLSDGSVAYNDGQPEATVDQMAWDVSNFLMWAAEPKLEMRKRIGWKVVLFVVILAALLYAAKRKMWADVH
ncbi:MAG: cytochrome c1 [Alphaproteobacteria bacterium]|jgi:ubiquinol-cytochrome c reductase cytochrome c1 subunit